MAESATTNGSIPSVEILTKEQAKALHTKLNQFYKKESGNKRKVKPLLKPIGDINILDLKVKVSKSPTDFDDLKNGMPFSLDPMGTVLYTKTGKERAICLNTMSPVPVGGASVYRVFL
jgi:hypothetical protein